MHILICERAYFGGFFEKYADYDDKRQSNP